MGILVRVNVVFGLVCGVGKSGGLLLGKRGTDCNGLGVYTVQW